MAKQISYYTKEGLEKLTNDLNELKTKGRSDIAKQIAEARDKGDLSENAEYDAAKDAQGHLEARIAKLEDLMAYARLVDESKIDIFKQQFANAVARKPVALVSLIGSASMSLLLKEKLLDDANMLVINAIPGSDVFRDPGHPRIFHIRASDGDHNLFGRSEVPHQCIGRHHDSQPFQHFLREII